MVQTKTDMSNMEIAPCPICGEPFRKKRHWQEGCGKAACRRKRSQIKIYSDMVKQIADNMISDFVRKVKEEGFRF